MRAKKLLQRLGEKTLWCAIAGLCATLRVALRNKEGFDRSVGTGRPAVIAFWHGSMLLPWYLLRPRGRQRAAALASRSEDGGILSATLAQWGYTVIRGSSHVGGKEAMQLMEHAVQDGCSVYITPDGPTGPRHKMKMGAVRLAQKTGVPLFLVGAASRPRREIQSWDLFEVPLPWSAAAVVFSDPIIVPPDLQGGGLDEYRNEVERQLVAMNDTAIRIMEAEGPAVTENS